MKKLYLFLLCLSGLTLEKSDGSAPEEDLYILDDGTYHYSMPCESRSYVRNSEWTKSHLPTYRRNRIEDVIPLYNALMHLNTELPEKFSDFCTFLKMHYDVTHQGVTTVGVAAFKKDLNLLGISSKEYEFDRTTRTFYSSSTPDVHMTQGWMNTILNEGDE